MKSLPVIGVPDWSQRKKVSNGTPRKSLKKLLRRITFKKEDGYVKRPESLEAELSELEGL